MHPSSSSNPSITHASTQKGAALTYGGVSRLSALTTTGGGLACRDEETRQNITEEKHLHPTNTRLNLHPTLHPGRPPRSC